MAPSFEAARPLQGTRKRPTPIVPAIPLSFTQRRKQPTVAVASEAKQSSKQSEEPSPTAVLPVNGTATEPPKKSDSNDGALRIQTKPQVCRAQESEGHSNGPESEPTPEQTQNGATVINGNGVHRSEYQMPPPFYPSTQQLTPTSSGSEGFRQPSTDDDAVAIQPPPQTNGNVVFGGYAESSTSSSAPSHMATVDAPDYSRQMPSYVNPNLQTPYQGPAPPVVESYPPYSHRPTYSTFSQNSDLHYPPRQVYDPYAAPSRNLVSVPPDVYTPFSPSGTPIDTGSQNLANLRDSRTSSRPNHSERSTLPSDSEPTQTSTSSGDHLGDPKFTRRETPSGHQANGRYHVVPSGRQHPPPPSGYPQGHAASADLQQYVLSQFGVSSLADHVLHLRHVRGRFAPLEIPVHALLIAQSAVLRSALEASAASQAGPTMTLNTEDHHLTPDAFLQALRSLYGAPRLELATLPNIEPSDEDDDEGPSLAEASKKHMKYVLAYIAAGHLLHLPAIACRGADLAVRLMSWATVEQVLAFAMDGGLDAAWKVKEARSPSAVSSRAASRRPSVVREQHSRGGSSNASALTSPVESVVNGTFREESSQPTYDFCASQLIHEALAFIVHNFPPEFTLDTTSHEAPLYARLPSTSDHHSRALSASLSSIRFGDYNSDDTSDTLSPTTISLSKILLSLPFQLLKHIFESPRLGSPSGWMSVSDRQRVARSVIDERERRRVTVLKNTAVSYGDRKARINEWEVVGWAEGVVTTYGGPADGVELTRKWKGLKNPVEKKKPAGQARGK